MLISIIILVGLVFGLLVDRSYNLYVIERYQYLLSRALEIIEDHEGDALSVKEKTDREYHPLMSPFTKRGSNLPKRSGGS